VRRQGECERREQERAPDEPGPYHGRTSDWAPDWMKLGLPDNVSDLFEACPA
jgi:hypothetical protein